MRVLLVEEDIRAGKLYADALGTRGLEVQIVCSAQEALNALDKELPDCIVLELDLRLHNGFEFIYEFCSQDDWKNLPIIVHTSVPARRLENILVSWDELNVVDYLYKPTTTLIELQDSVVSAINSKVK